MRSPSETLGVDFSRRLPATWSLITALMLVHGVGALAADGRLSLLDSLVFPRPPWLRGALGGQQAALVDAGQWWRLATSVCVHSGLLHLALNLAAIAALGRVLEPWVGSARLLGWFAVGGWLASVSSHLAGMAQSDGASGGAFALLGAVAAIALRRRERLPPGDRWLLGPALWSTIAVNLGFSFVVPQIDAIAHVSGLVAGLAFGMGLEPGPQASGFAAGAFIVVCVWGWTVGLP